MGSAASTNSGCGYIAVTEPPASFAAGSCLPFTTLFSGGRKLTSQREVRTNGRGEETADSRTGDELFKSILHLQPGSDESIRGYCTSNSSMEEASLKEKLTDSKEAARMELVATNSQHNLAELSMEMAGMKGSSMEIAAIKPSQQGPALPALPGTMVWGRPRDRGRPRENHDVAHTELSCAQPTGTSRTRRKTSSPCGTPCSGEVVKK